MKDRKLHQARYHTFVAMHILQNLNYATDFKMALEMIK